MSTITREFTKEQLIEHINGRKEFADECAADSTLHPERREYYELTAEALRIALASLEAEAVAWRCGSTVTVNKPVADDWKRRGFAFHPLYAAPPAPVVPNGWVLVPVEPTEDMIVEGFESEPDESFSDAGVWEEYEAMSGCQQAAHRAKLCWAAMIAAAPQQEVEL